jgi:hypothetical protein
LHSINAQNEQFIYYFELTDAMQKDVIQRAMYYLHQYACVYPLLVEDESTTHENVEFEQAFLCYALLSLALKAAFQN